MKQCPSFGLDNHDNLLEMFKISSPENPDNYS